MKNSYELTLAINLENGGKHMTCLLVLMVPNWKIEFHLHTNTSNFALEAMLGQNPNNTIDRPIYYASKLVNNA
jgi:hypothetical protein